MLGAVWFALLKAFGLDDGNDGLSFNKLVTTVALATFVYCVVTRREPSWPLLSFGIVVIGAGFGLKGYLGGVKQNTMIATTHTDTAKLVEAVRENRDHDKGIDPA